MRFGVVTWSFVAIYSAVNGRGGALLDMAVAVVVGILCRRIRSGEVSSVRRGCEKHNGDNVLGWFISRIEPRSDCDYGQRRAWCSVK